MSCLIGLHENLLIRVIRQIVRGLYRPFFIQSVARLFIHFMLFIGWALSFQSSSFSWAISMCNKKKSNLVQYRLPEKNEMIEMDENCFWGGRGILLLNYDEDRKNFLGCGWCLASLLDVIFLSGGLLWAWSIYKTELNKHVDSPLSAQITVFFIRLLR